MKAADLAKITKSVTKKWTAQRKREKRNSRARFYRSEYMYSDRVYQTDVAWEVIPKAYEKASSNGSLPAHARQIFYAARGEIQERTGRPLESQYFTQTLLPKYINEHPEAADWWVVYDARGHLIEPHTEESVPLGTLEVNKYLNDVHSHETDSEFEFTKQFKDEFPTTGPANRSGAILFIEKEGFNPLFKEVKLAKRYDIAIMSTKGQSVVAARRLVDELCYDDVQLLVLHDFDKSGLEIAQNLTSVSEAAMWANRVRYEFRNEINVIDLGLRLADIEEWNLQPESVRFKGRFGADSIATPEEQEFLRGNQRVELNAFTSADFIKWIESKLEEHGIEKVIPEKTVLEDAYRRAYQIATINRQLANIKEEAAAKAQQAKPGRGLAKVVRDAFEEDPERSWDEVVAELASDRVAAESNGKGRAKSKQSRKRRKE